MRKDVAGRANLDIVNIAIWVMQRQASRRRTTALCTSLHFSLREWPTLDCAQFLTHPPWARRDAPLALASTVSSCAFCEQKGHLAATASSLTRKRSGDYI